MVDSFRIQNCSFKISQPVRSVRFQEIMGCFNFGFWVYSKLRINRISGTRAGRDSEFSFQFGRRGSQTFILECGIMRVEKRFSMRIQH